MFETHKITKSMGGSSSPGQQETSLQPGANLQNRYLVQSILGVGGMGSVYLARDMHFPNVEKMVAVKEILNLADASLREMIVKTFEREANLLATLNHPSIPKIYDYFTQGERSFLVMEYIEGKDLEAALNGAQGFLGEETVVEWAIQLCDVLSYLHNHEPEPIVFRDMKPSNVMLDGHNHIRLIDFGIARGFVAGQKGTMIGTEGYSPPEQYRGEAGPPGDMYALGATLHHLLTKQDPRLEPPFSFGERPIRKTNPVVTVELEAIVNTALSYNPSERFPSAKAMKDALINLRRMRTGVLTGQFAALVPAQGALVAAAQGATAQPAQAAQAASDVKPVWTFRAEDELRGSPTVGNGVVYIGCYDNNLYAVSATEGKLMWKYATDGGLPGTPATHDDAVLIGSEDKRLHCVSARSGRVQWTYYTDAPVRGSPRVAEGHIFIGSDDAYLHAVNAGTGRRAWRAQAVESVRGRPAVSSDMIFFGCESGEFYAVDFTGEQKWRFKAKRAITSSPLLHNGVVFFGSVDGQVYALEAKSGWAVWKFRTNKPVISSPAVESKLNYVLVGSSDNNLYCIESKNGREVWHFAAEGQVNSSPVVHNGVVYFGSVDGSVYAVDIATGKQRWRFRTERPITSSPAVFNDTVFVGSLDHHLYALTA